MYENLASRIRFERQDTRIGALFAAGAIVLMLMAASLSLV